MMRIYICGPMTGLPEHNCPTFAAATNALVDAGYDVSSPHEIVITKPHGEPTWHDYMRAPWWLSTERAGGSQFQKQKQVTEVTPLVVLDPRDSPVGDLTSLLRDVRDGRDPAWKEESLTWIASEWEKQTAPHRMAEPGWGEKVIAHTAGDPTRREFVRYGDLPYRWSARDACDGFRWDDLLDPRPVGGDS